MELFERWGYDFGYWLGVTLWWLMLPILFALFVLCVWWLVQRWRRGMF